MLLYKITSKGKEDAESDKGHWAHKTNDRWFYFVGQDAIKYQKTMM